MLSGRRIILTARLYQPYSRLFSVSALASQKANTAPTSDTPFADAFLRESGRAEPKSQEEADAFARAALEDIKKTARSLKPDGTTFEPSKVFAPEGASRFNYLTWVRRKQAEDLYNQKYNPPVTEEQAAKAASISDSPVPPKNDETMEYLASVIMRHGKKARARKTLNNALYLVHLKLRVDPVAALKEALDKMGPQVKLKRFSDGGARVEMVPRPLTDRQRMRQAWNWIIEASDRRGSRQFGVRLGEEIAAAIQGTSPGFEKKAAQHKLAISNRAFISLMK